jgi:hypothetical protein
MVVGATAGGAGLGAGVLGVATGALCGVAVMDSAGAGLGVSCGGLDTPDVGSGAVVCCAVALNAASREAVIIHFQVRMTQILSLA